MDKSNYEHWWFTEMKNKLPQLDGDASKTRLKNNLHAQ